MSTLTKQWLQQKIAEMEAARDEIPFGLDEGDSNTLAALRIALASLEAEVVCVIDQSNLDYLKSGSDADVWPASRAEMGDVLLYRSAPPSPVAVPEGYRLQPISEYDAMCAAMLQGAENAGSPTTMKTAPALDSSPKIAESPSGINQGKSEPVTTAYKSPDDFICMLTGRAKYLREKGEIKSPELLERAAAALQDEIVNTPPIPNGWKLVPIDPTKDMLRAGQSVVGFWLNTVHCYSKMLAAAPEAPQQEVK
jgi:hypothetical protein